MNTATVAFLIIAATFFLTDLIFRIIPNLIVIPAIGLGIFMTGHWVWVLLMIIPGLMLVGPQAFKTQNTAFIRWNGGDIKLFMMAGAFIGWLALPVLGVTLLFIKFYRFILRTTKPLPVAPFMFPASVLTLATIRIP